MDKSKSAVIKKIIIFIFLFFIFNINFCFAANLKDAFGKPLQDAAGSAGAGYNTESAATAESMAALIIKTALSFIGVIFLLLAIYGGYMWMMARGNEQEVEKARNIIISAIIGLIIVVAAYAASYFIIQVLGLKVLK